MIALALCVCVGCRSVRYVPVQGQTVVETRYVERIDTVNVEVLLPAQSVVNVTVDSVSHLETDIARSDAWVDSMGRLHHSLDNKSASIPAEVPVRTVRLDSIVTVDRPVPYPVERSLTLWERIKLDFGGWALLALGALTATVALRFLYQTRQIISK